MARHYSPVSSKSQIYSISGIFLALLLLISPFILTANAAEAVSVNTAAVYGKDYTFENILTDFQYFVQNDATISNHTVGGVAVGGTFSLSSSMGDGQVSPSYVNHCSAGMTNIINDGGYLSGTSYSSLKNNVFYYETIDSSVPQWLSDRMTKHTGTTPYIDFTSAFSALSSQSTALAASAVYTVTGSDVTGTTLTIDFSKGKNVKIPYDVIVSKAVTDYKITGVSSVADFTASQYTVSFTGINSSPFLLDFGKIKLDSSDFTNALKSLGGTFAGGQVCFSGMKLIWNFPDATQNVTINSASGHMIAPLASLAIDGGNFEGGVVAKNLSHSSAEGHYYTYYDPTVTSTPVSSTAASSTPTSSTAASSTPTSSTAASSAPTSSTAASSTPTSSTAASSTPTSSTPTPSTPVPSTVASTSTTSAGGIVVDGKTGAFVQKTPTKVTTEANYETGSSFPYITVFLAFISLFAFIIIRVANKTKEN